MSFGGLLGDLVTERYSDDGRTALLRALRLGKRDAFQLVAVEVLSPVERAELRRWIEAKLPGRTVVEVSLRVASVDGDVHGGIVAALAGVDRGERSPIVLLTELEESRGAALEPNPAVFAQLNLQRDSLVRDVRLQCVLCAHPAALLKLRTVAPDFCDFFTTLVRASVGDAPPEWRLAHDSSWTTTLSVADPDWPALLREANRAMTDFKLDEARDALAQFRASALAEEWQVEATLLATVLEGTSSALPESEWARLLELSQRARPSTRAKALLFVGAREASAGHRDVAQLLWDDAERIFTAIGDGASLGWLELDRSDALRLIGEIEQSERHLRRAEELFSQTHRSLGLRLVMMRQAQFLLLRGRLEESLALLRERVLPECEKGDADRHRAVALGLVADAIQRRGDVEEALRIRREDQLPLFLSCGDRREYAVTYGRIADALHAGGDLDEAIRIRREVEIPAFAQEGDLRELAVSNAKLASALADKGDVRGAIRLMQAEVMPVLPPFVAHAEVAYLAAQLASWRARSGDSAALIDLSRAIDDLDVHGSARDALSFRRTLAELLAQRRRFSESQAVLQQNVVLSSSLPEPEPLVMATVDLIGLLLALRDPAAARAALSRSRDTLAAAGRWSAMDKLAPLDAEIARVERPSPSSASPASPNRAARRAKRKRR